MTIPSSRFGRAARLLVLALAAVGLPGVASAAEVAAEAAPRSLEVSPPTLKFQRHSLDNGMKLLLNEDHSVPVVTVQLWYHVGSKNERTGRSGFAHLFEHLMFQGSENMEPTEHSSYIDSIGGRDNATTDFDRTLYFSTIPSNHLERLLWMEADRLRSLDVSEDNFQEERDVVKEERRLRTDNPPFGRLIEVVLDAVYDVHPYKITPIGSMADLDAATIEDVREFHQLYYKPNNLTMVISGDFEPQEALGWVGEYFGPIPHGAEISREIAAEPKQTAEKRKVVYDVNAPLPAAITVYHIPEDGHPDYYPINIAGNILSNGQSSRLYRKMVYEQQMALQAGGQAFGLEDPGAFFFFAILNQGQEPEAGEKALAEEVDKLQNELVGSEELQKAKNQQVSQLVFGRQTTQNKANAIGYAEVILGDANLANTEVDRYQKITAEDIQRVAKKYFTDDNKTVIYMLPEAMRPAEDSGAADMQTGDEETGR